MKTKILAIAKNTNIHKIEKGVLYMILASLTFAVMGGFAKILSKSIPPLEITFFRNIFGVGIVLAMILKLPSNNKGGKPLLLFFRGFMGFLALLAYFYNMAHIPLAEAITYNKTSPLFLAFFAWIFLKESLPKSALLALILGFLGIVLIAKPIGSGFDKYDILGIFSGIGAALAYTSIRELRKHYDTRTISLSFMLVGALGPLILMIVAANLDHIPKDFDFILANFVWPKELEWIYIIALGVSATASQLLMTKAYSLSKAGIVGAITYSQILFATLIGVALGDTIPDIYSWIGMILITLAGILVSTKK